MEALQNSLLIHLCFAQTSHRNSYIMDEVRNKYGSAANSVPTSLSGHLQKTLRWKVPLCTLLMQMASHCVRKIRPEIMCELAPPSGPLLSWIKCSSELN